MSIEDPFDQVLEDTKEQLTRLINYLPSHNIDSEVIDIVKDVTDTINDLDRSLVVMKRNQLDTSERETSLNEIKQQLNDFRQQYNINGHFQAHSESNNAAAIDHNLENNNEQGPPINKINGLQDQILHEQDIHLDNIHQTMKNLHLQAQTMGEELEDQGRILDDLDNNFDSVTNKLSRSRRQLEWVYEKNKEKFNDCCILLLIIALIILLVLAFIA
ncbi:hypothetical protein RI543_004114 [Arxiozyma heterogenica]|uniref:t-SNARE affecting a late Golgi compartment protein 1 n=1 Tax=Arxiozyma heterogenica TaxID=278026 RepID=A0AAN7WHU9_9SACH|nr:hypothetical protein RI543_004114 [Kazachstania heterogenica]